MIRPNTTPNWRKPRVDPFATSDIAREHELTATQAWMLHLLAIQAEYRSGEWTGSQIMLTDALRSARATVKKDMAALIKKGLVAEVERFRQGGEGRVRVLVRDRIVLSSPRPKIVQPSTISGAEDCPPIVHQMSTDCPPNVQPDAIDQGELGDSQVLRHGGSEVYESGTCCTVCGQAADGHHPFDHDPIVAPMPEDAPPLSDDDFDAWVSA